MTLQATEDWLYDYPFFDAHCSPDESWSFELFVVLERRRQIAQIIPKRVRLHSCVAFGNYVCFQRWYRNDIQIVTSFANPA